MKPINLHSLKSSLLTCQMALILKGGKEGFGLWGRYNYGLISKSGSSGFRMGSIPILTPLRLPS